jgi:acyl carrier protein
MNTIAEEIKQIIAEILNLDPDEIDLDNTFTDDLGADSLDVFQIIMGIESKFDIDIPTDKVETISTVGEAMELIQFLLDQ